MSEKQRWKKDAMLGFYRGPLKTREDGTEWLELAHLNNLEDECDALQAEVTALRGALEKIVDTLAGPNGLDVPASYVVAGTLLWETARAALAHPES